MILTRDEFPNFERTVDSENPVKYLSVDPGKSNGICGYDDRHYLVFMYTVMAEDMIQFLQTLKTVKMCIIEDYRLYPNKIKQQIYSDMETTRVIGRVESWAELGRIELVKQGAHIKQTGYKWIGQKPPSKSDPRNHEKDAHVHFIYWAVMHGKIKAVDLLRKPNQIILK